MKLEEYIKSLKSEIDSFEANWKENHAKTPEEWPMEIPNKAEWDEQFLAHYTSKMEAEDDW